MRSKYYLHSAASNPEALMQHRDPHQDETSRPIIMQYSTQSVQLKKPSGVYSPKSDQYTSTLVSSANALLREANAVGEEEQNGWQPLATKKGVKMWKKCNMHSSPQLCLKASSVVPGSPGTILEYLATQPRTAWDAMCKESKVVEKLDSFTEVHYSLYEATNCLIRIPRDIVFAVRWHETNNGGYIVAGASVQHNAAPPKEGVVRMNLHPTGWIITPLFRAQGENNSSVQHLEQFPNSPLCELTFILGVDFKVTHFPSVFMNIVLNSHAMNVHRVRHSIKMELLQHREKIKYQDAKYKELAEMFESDEHFITFFMKKMQQQNPAALQKAIDAFARGANTIVQEVVHEVVNFDIDVQVPSQEKLNGERGRSRSNSWSEKNLSYGEFEGAGGREMEDSHVCIKLNDPESGLQESCYFFAVFDGHYGNLAAMFCKEYFHQEFFKHLKETKDAEKALELSFQTMEANFLAEAERKQTEAGTTAVIAVIHGNKLVVGNVGDSEAVLFRGSRPVLLSEVHSALRNESEVKRVKKAGGVIHTNAKLAHPVWNPNIISLGVTRAIGDLYFKSGKYTENKPTGLSPLPAITQTVISSGDDFLVLASDGLWSVIKHQDVVTFIADRFKQGQDVSVVCKQLTEWALSKGGKDNVTVIIVQF